MGAEAQTYIQHRHYRVWVVWKDQRQNYRLYYRPSGHLQNNNAFRQIRLSDYRQYLSSPAGFRTHTNLSNWRLYHPTKFWLRCISYKTCESLSMQYVEARTSTNLISNFSQYHSSVHLLVLTTTHFIFSSKHLLGIRTTRLKYSCHYA